jgi:hypothetical protein
VEKNAQSLWKTAGKRSYPPIDLLKIWPLGACATNNAALHKIQLCGTAAGRSFASRYTRSGVDAAIGRWSRPLRFANRTVCFVEM